MLIHNYVQWLTAIDKEKFEAIADAKVWCLIICTFVLIIFVASHAPLAADFFQLQAGKALLWLLPVCVCAALVSSKKLRRIWHWNSYGVLMIATSASFQLFLWSMVCFSKMPGATVMAALPILLAAYHGEFFQISAKYPWGAIATISAILGAMQLSPDKEHLSIIIVGGLIGLGAAFTMGNHARLQNHATKERNALKQAVDAQTLLDSVQEVEQAQDLVQEIRGTNHDAGNALSGILMNLDFLCDRLSNSEISKAELDETREIASDLSNSTIRLRKLIEKGREAGKKSADAESVNVYAVIDRAISDAKASHPRVNYKLGQNEERQSKLFVNLHGGELSLHRMLTNLLANAAEGNGRAHAKNIVLKVINNEKALNIAVSDDGPGFSAEQLAQNIAEFKTTKDTGTGLGLYTTQRLISANRGELKYENNAESGAIVTVMLPRQLTI